MRTLCSLFFILVAGCTHMSPAYMQSVRYKPHKAGIAVAASGFPDHPEAKKQTADMINKFCAPYGFETIEISRVSTPTGSTSTTIPGNAYIAPVTYTETDHSTDLYISFECKNEAKQKSASTE